ncbi:hypothetical protein [Nocardia sp. NPDC051981]|uniref:hypothetical protein n=1 Tax=Nocardia sp. NPDC051981 TaxID=3155417 RepID=UPI00343DA37D
MAKAFVPGMRERGWGRVVRINGEDGWLGGWTRVPHSVGKGGLRTLTKSLASGLGQYGCVPSCARRVQPPSPVPLSTSMAVNGCSDSNGNSDRCGGWPRCWCSVGRGVLRNTSRGRCIGCDIRPSDASVECVGLLSSYVSGRPEVHSKPARPTRVSRCRR